eukprot:11203532-Lingulodinium_polyedra.AAC.1
MPRMKPRAVRAGRSILWNPPSALRRPMLQPAAAGAAGGGAVGAGPVCGAGAAPPARPAGTP